MIASIKKISTFPDDLTPFMRQTKTRSQATSRQPKKIVIEDID